MVLKIILWIFSLISVLNSQRSQYDENKLYCLSDEIDNETCIYADINDPMELFAKIPDQNNLDAQNIKRIKFSNCYLDNLNSQLLKSFSNVEEIHAANQYIIRIDQNDIGSSESLKKLNLSFNKIHRLSADAITGIKNLENLDFSHNKLERIMLNAFKFNVNLKYLNLSHNEIVSLDRQFFDEVRSVEVLKLDNNRITEITGNFDRYISVTRELYLQNNYLKSIDSQLLKNPTYLDLSLNKLIELDLKSARTTELRVVGNELRKLSIGLKLQKLDASENRFYYFRIISEGESNNLVHMNLSYIKYNMNDEKIFIDFRKFDKLRILDLSDNNLISFDITDISYGVSRTLEILNLNNAHLKYIKNWEKIGFLLPNLKQLDIFDNIFKCDQLEKMIPYLLTLNISLPGYDSSDNGTYISRSCMRYPPDMTEKPFINVKVDHSLFIWIVVIFFICGILITSIVYINKRFSIFQKIYYSAKVNPNKPRGSQLLDEEKANDPENTF
ncbi:chondroadherin-like [Chironomus tepperi]|uniref:chondroadherin-like n=1 Tax=Chironomus tepperi TaxID=113505 RepID=UPI00391F3D0B